MTQVNSNIQEIPDPPDSIATETSEKSTPLEVPYFTLRHLAKQKHKYVLRAQKTWGSTNKFWLQQLGVKKRALAKTVGISTSYLERQLNLIKCKESVTNPKLSDIMFWCETLGMDPAWLFLKNTQIVQEYLHEVADNVVMSRQEWKLAKVQRNHALRVSNRIYQREYRRRRKELQALQDEITEENKRKARDRMRAIQKKKRDERIAQGVELRKRNWEELLAQRKRARDLRREKVNAQKAMLLNPVDTTVKPS